LPAGSRVQDAIAAAGGMASNADPGAVNQAAILTDGKQIALPTVRPTPNPSAPALAGAKPAQRSPTAAPHFPININTATTEELDWLPGVGPETAKHILEYRDKNGAFHKIEQIMDVPGIGPATFQRIKDLIMIGEENFR
jgi:competence protein ComEA